MHKRLVPAVQGMTTTRVSPREGVIFASLGFFGIRLLLPCTSSRCLGDRLPARVVVLLLPLTSPVLLPGGWETSECCA